jgi:hypothetical protein
MASSLFVNGIFEEIPMLIKMMLLSAAALLTLNCPDIAHSYEYDQEETTKLVMEMIIDLGGHDAVRKNSGKTMHCSYGGKRKVSIIKHGATTTYSGDYRNCREKGSTRDGLYEIILDGDEIVSSSSKRSVNGALFDAAMQGDVGKVRKLIKAKADVNYTESIPKSEGGYIDEITPLMLATMSGSLDTVKVLVSNGAWVNYLNSMVVNALWIAANTGHGDIVKYLGQRGAYINNRNSEDVTPIMAATMNGYQDIVRYLVSAGAELDYAHKEGDTALMFALARKHSDIARLLIDSGADINIRNKFGVTALIIATAEGNEKIVKLLLEKKADASAKTSDGKTALDVARARGLTGIVALLEKVVD